MPQAKNVGLITKEQKETFQSLQDRFYQQLKDEGFVDIEDASNPERPLKEWHNLKYSSEKVLQKIEIRKEYQRLLDNFTNHKDFEEICEKIVARKYREKKLTIIEVKKIWQHWAHEGWTERRIAHEMSLSKTNIHQILERFRKWMALTT